MKEKLPGIIVTATIMVILAIPTHGGSLLAYVKDLLASAVIPSLLAVGVASNIREIFEAYSAYTKIGEVAEELEGFSQRAAYSGYLNTYSFFQGLRGRIRENQGYVVGSTALDLLADVTIRDLLITFGREDAGEYEKGKALGRLVGAALSLATYIGIYYKFLSNGPKLLSHAGQIKEFLKGVYNWITPPLWDVGVAAGKLSARGIAAALAFSEESDDFRQRLNEVKDDEGSLSPLVESIGRFLDDALDVSNKLGLSEGAFLGLLLAYGKCGLSGEAWSKYIQEIERIGGKNKKCADELLRSILNAESSEVEHAVIKVVPRLAELSPDELEALAKLLASGIRIREIGVMLEKPGRLEELLGGIKEFEFREELKKITLNMGKDCSLHMGEGNELKPGTYMVKIYWKYGEKSGVMEFPIVKEVESHRVSISSDQVEQVLKEIGEDEAEILVAKAEFLDYRLSFPRSFSASGIEMKLDIYGNEIKLNGRSYEFRLKRTRVHDGKIRAYVELPAKNLKTGEKLVFFFSQDGKVGMELGGRPYRADEIRMDDKLNYIEIVYSEGEAEYSFNLKPLSEQMGRYFHEIPLGKHEKKSSFGLKEELRRLLGYDAEMELEEGMGSKYGVLVGFDNGGKAYTGTSRLVITVPEGASKIEWIGIVSIKDTIPRLLHEIIKAGSSSKVANKIGEAGARIVIEGYEEKEISYKRDILMKFSEKTGVSIIILESKVDLMYVAEPGKKEVDGIVKAKEDIVIDKRVCLRRAR
ncbi:MAG: hypothetical protein FGF50_02070 [Candidatus Brockarchaeota archaeon]|nr:hypothetical protein [Candidatus Brockarchaeota archaeon]